MRANYRLPGVNEHRPRSKVPIHTQTQLLSVEHQLLHELRLSRAKPPFSCITVCAAHPNERAQKPLSREQPDSIADSHDPRGSASSITFMHCTVRHCHFRGAGGNPAVGNNWRPGQSRKWNRYCIHRSSVSPLPPSSANV